MERHAARSLQRASCPLNAYAMLHQYYEAESWYLLRSTKPGVRVRELCRRHQIETLRDYRHRSRREIDDARQSGKRI
ncbi:MAG: hypothetical protein HUU20_12555 [Pirellulales bacterium]|nr:hypothetical protein [Pirellulales bacterium]